MNLGVHSFLENVTYIYTDVGAGKKKLEIEGKSFDVRMIRVLIPYSRASLVKFYGQAME
jgi:hypothetical protein